MDTSAPELAHEWLAASYVERTPRITVWHDGFRMRVAGRATDVLRFDDVVHSAHLHADVEPYRCVFVCRLRAGRYRMTATGPGARRTEAPTPGHLLMMDPPQAWPHRPGAAADADRTPRGDS